MKSNTELEKVISQMKKDYGEESKAAKSTEALTLHMRASKALGEERAPRIRDNAHLRREARDTRRPTCLPRIR